ncbi:MAG: hypothetical protein IV092_12105 [Burkholderiaceae bacterium]|nr:hypothetical protein [Burkholderiaceae bacterium]
MKREDSDVQQLQPAPEQLELVLARIESSTAFRGSARHRALLRYLVVRTLQGDASALKETVIALEVFERPAASFDPRLDSIVRVEARRLRQRLSEFYAGDGRELPLRITLPVGSYVPVIASVEAREPESATRRARDLVERGEHFLRLPLSQATLEQALERFDMAVRESPGHAPAYVGLARAWFNLASGWYHPPAAASEHAAEALRQALVLDDTNAVAHALLGAIQHQFEHDWDGAQRSFRRAVELAPQMAFVHSAYGRHLVAQGLLSEAERELLLARSLDPQYLNTRLHMVNLRIGQARLDDAEREIDGAADLAPDNMALEGLRGLLALQRGDGAAALRHYGRCCELLPDHAGCLASLAAAQAFAGEQAQSDATMARLQGRAVPPYIRAIVDTRSGRLEQALAQLRSAVLERDPNIVFIGVDPSFQRLHGEPAWRDLLASIKPRRDD